jgi:hypothetical protein
MNTSTPVSYWWELPIRELLDWADTCFDMLEEAKREREVVEGG